LLGEHGVVHGRPALAAGLARGIEATAELAEAHRLEVEPWNLVVGADPDGENLLERAFAVAVDGRGERGIRVHARSSIPAGAGLGGSAALGVAVIGAIDELLGAVRTPEALADAAFQWEKVFHGNPSGVDNTMAALGGVAVYRRGKPLVPVRVKRPLPLVIANTGEHASTKTMVDSVARQYERDRVRVEKTFEAMETLVANGRLAVEAGDFVALGQLMNLNQNLLGSLMLSTEKLEDACRVARAEGALGAKLTGSGGGGCAIALARDVVEAERIAESLREVVQEAFVLEAGR
jgi:mevalonate kinase